MTFSWILYLSALSTAAYASPLNSFEYDYIIVGGGTAGCVLANRLSANPSISVALVEAGPTVFNDSRVLIPSPAGPTWGTELDWNYTTIPQIYANNSILQYHAGRDVGGTSTINGMVYLRPTVDEVGSWSALGNPELSWDSLLPYFKKSEHLQLPTAPNASAKASYEASVHGFVGPVKVGWGNDLNPGEYGQALNTTWQSLGFSWNRDPNTGNNTGLALFPIEKDTVLQIRQDSARSYYLPVMGRPNLHAFTNTTALNVNLDGGKSHHGPQGLVVAKGVNVVLPSGKKQFLRSKQEVILSTGTYRTPGAIYNPSFTLESLTPSYNAKPMTGTLTAADLFGDELDTVAAQLYKDIPSYARTLSEASNGAISIQAQEQILLARANLFFKKNIAIGQYTFQIYGGNRWVTLPLSTENVHSSSDPAKPLLNPNFMQLPWDTLVMQRLFLVLRRILSAPSVQHALGPNATTELSPGYSLVPADASLPQWTSFFQSALAPTWHAVGSAVVYVGSR
ncbi:unnamed protein product [Aureobasidium vineae]|uniref:Glucose-methanol-choline oxidoreductase N-terminal domain-containing protein n=1 Tax=Aureobasidium vineae TaxID=2773715 RepID=A0A9N8P4V1_9PEZI|nr:unnamed protein product [Aureobasidium vineae]